MRLACTVFIFTLALTPPLFAGSWDVLNPLYTKHDLVSDPLLPGTWELDGVGCWHCLETSRLVLEFQPIRDHGYYLIFTQDDYDFDTGKHDRHRVLEFYACLVRLGRIVFLDLQPKAVPVEATTETFQLTPSSGHGDKSAFSPPFFHLNGGDGTLLSIGLFGTLAAARDGNNTDTYSSYELRFTPAHIIFRIWVDQTTLRLSVFEPPGGVATLSTKDLQKLALQYADDADVFSDFGKWQRKNGGSR